MAKQAFMRSARGSPLCRFVLHHKIEKDLFGLINEMMGNEDGKILLQSLLHAATDRGQLDPFEFTRDPIERGIRYFTDFEINDIHSNDYYRTRDTPNENTLPRGRAPFRGQMFITATQKDGSVAEFVLKAEKLKCLLGTPLVPRRPHSVSR